MGHVVGVRAIGSLRFITGATWSDCSSFCVCANAWFVTDRDSCVGRVCDAFHVGTIAGDVGGGGRGGAG